MAETTSPTARVPQVPPSSLSTCSKCRRPSGHRRQECCAQVQELRMTAAALVQANACLKRSTRPSPSSFYCFTARLRLLHPLALPSFVTCVLCQTLRKSHHLLYVDCLHYIIWIYQNCLRRTLNPKGSRPRRSERVLSPGPVPSAVLTIHRGNLPEIRHAYGKSGCRPAWIPRIGAAADACVLLIFERTEPAESPAACSGCADAGKRPRRS